IHQELKDNNINSPEFKNSPEQGVGEVKVVPPSPDSLEPICRDLCVDQVGKIAPGELARITRDKSATEAEPGEFRKRLVFVHGVFGKPYDYANLINRLQALPEFDVYVFRYPTLWKSAKAIAEQLASWIARLHQEEAD